MTFKCPPEQGLLTENVGDFVAIAEQHSTTGGHHPGLLIALPTRFSRRRSGNGRLIAHRDEDLTDRITYLEAIAR